MLDFWELLGRVATDKNFRGSMLGFANAAPSKDKRCDCRVFFGASDYAGLRQLVARVRNDLPISLAALGEWMVLKSLFPIGPYLQSIQDQITRIAGAPASTDRQFYQVLGLSMIDDTFAAQFDNKKKFGFSLSDTDFNSILALNRDAQFRDACKKFHDVAWSTDCKAWMFESPAPAGPNPVRHVHPLDPDEHAALLALRTVEPAT